MTALTAQRLSGHPPTDADAIAFVEHLVATPSVSGSEADAVRVYVHAGARIGMRCEIDGAGNGIARRGPEGAGTHIALLGHIDTVPGRITVRTEGGVLHGRGSVDAKGPLAAMLVAAARADLPPGVALDVIAAVGEETHGSPGAVYVRDRMRPDACIIGEPSGWDGVTLGYKGRLVVHAQSVRPCAHSAGPDPSAGDDIHAWWARTLEAVERLNEGRAGAFERVQAKILRVHTSADDAHERARIEAGFRIPVGLAPGDVLAIAERSARGEIEVTSSGGEHAVCSDRNDPVVRALTQGVRGEGGRPRLKVKTGTADFNVVAPVWRCPIAAYGPGDSSLDHTPEERLDLDEYLRSIGVLRRAIEALTRELRPPGR